MLIRYSRSRILCPCLLAPFSKRYDERRCTGGYEGSQTWYDGRQHMQSVHDQRSRSCCVVRARIELPQSQGMPARLQ